MKQSGLREQLEFGFINPKITKDFHYEGKRVVVNFSTRSRMTF